ncbi:tpr domain-containing [Cystoisospora suis]|uniref:Tpr domain-containing n=1 Tax=Cystoisospora suis TaxID=483139 RepID=A0A2C6KP39_9APIC|nr:tpr domain-containing [Cystoisospora suis]
MTSREVMEDGEKKKKKNFSSSSSSSTTSTPSPPLHPSSSIEHHGRPSSSSSRDNPKEEEEPSSSSSLSSSSSTSTPGKTLSANPFGSGICTVGGEAPVEQRPEEKFCVEKDSRLSDSVLWCMLDNYYKAMAIKAWAHDYVPSFVTSNSRLCRSYARIIFNFLQDFYSLSSAPPKHPVVILEIGGGHGRFTYLLLQALLRYRHLYKDLNLPEKPFLYVFSDVAEANVSFCLNHSSFRQWREEGWVDFAIFDGNDKRSRIHLLYQKYTVPLDTPIVAIANYVFDSLLTDAWKITPDKEVEYHRALVSVYSPQIETDPTDAEIMVRMSLGWNWEPVHTLASSSSGDSSGVANAEKSDGDSREARASPSSPQEEKKEMREEEKERDRLQDDTRPQKNEGDGSSDHFSSSSLGGGGGVETDKKGRRRRAPLNYLDEDPTIRRVLEKYRDMKKTLSFVLPVGAFCLFKNLLRLSGDQLFCLIGDKGYPTAEEFSGERDPHIAIHGSISFMLNLHSIRLYFDALGEEEEEEEKKEKEKKSLPETERGEEKKKRIGFSMSTPYRDTFQITGLWCCGEKRNFPRSRAAFLDDLEDMTPDGLIQWQRSCQETLLYAGETSVKIKELLPLLRYSGHDPDILLNFDTCFTSQCLQPYISARTEQDLLVDIEKVFGNWYKLKKGEDVADICAHICMKLGRCDLAIKYLQASVEMCPESLHSSTYVNLAACFKVLGDFAAGVSACEKALELQPNYPQATEMLKTLQVCQNPIKIACVGLGYWSKYEAVPLLRRERRVQIIAVYAFKQADAERFLSFCDLNPGEVEVYSGSSGYKALLTRSDVQAILLDVHAKLMPSFLSKIFESSKHVLTRSPLAFDLKTAWNLIQTYSHFNSLSSSPPPLEEPLEGKEKERPKKEGEKNEESLMKGGGGELVWHALESSRGEEAFQSAKKILGSLGEVTSVNFHLITNSLSSSSSSIHSHSNSDSNSDNTRDSKAPSTTTTTTTGGGGEAYPFSYFPYDVKEHLSLELLRCLSAVRAITGESLACLGATYSTGLVEHSSLLPSSSSSPCSDGAKEGRHEAKEEEEGEQRERGTTGVGLGGGMKKETRLRRVKEFPRLTGWFQLTSTPRHGQTSSRHARLIPGSYLVTPSVGDNSLQFRICCLHGVLELVKSASSWEIKTFRDFFLSSSTSSSSSPPPPSTVSVQSYAVQSVGHQNCHDAWIHDLYTSIFAPPSNASSLDGKKESSNELQEKKTKITKEEKEQTPQQKGSSLPLVDVTVNAALTDSSIFEAIQQSIQGGGVPVKFMLKGGGGVGEAPSS